MSSRQTSTSTATNDLELCTIRSNSSHDHLFPRFYRREGAAAAAAATATVPTHIKPADRVVVYAPMAEQKKLGYFSTACLIISKVIGTGVFAKPSVVLENSGGKAVSLGLWFVCGLMSLAGFVLRGFFVVGVLIMEKVDNLCGAGNCAAVFGW
jgi:hypothetical protein